MVQQANVPQLVFKRHEMKYLLSSEDREGLMALIDAEMAEDAYGPSHISSIYFDTPTGLLARRSIEGGTYKEKLRVRCYGEATSGSDVFVEIKKKVDGITYKRRVSARADVALATLCSGSFPGTDQISHEIDWFLRRYENLEPSLLVTYDRCAYYARHDMDFRLTLDRTIRWQDRRHASDLSDASHALLDTDMTLMEVKTSAALPLWLVDYLERREIRQTSFSKFGKAYVAREEICSAPFVATDERIEDEATEALLLPVSADLFRLRIKTPAAADHAEPAHMKGRNVSYA